MQPLIVLLILLGLAACGAASPTTAVPERVSDPTLVPSGAEQHYVGDLIEPAIRLQDFELPSNLPDIQHLSDLQGKWLVIFFGYLHCPDFCPLTLSDYKQVQKLLGEDASHIRFVFISVDAVRDDAEALRTYLANFDPAFVGFAADDATLARIQPDYGFYYSRRLSAGTGATYTIDHSTRSYLVDTRGYLRATFKYNTDPALIAQAIQSHLRSDSSQELTP